MKITPYNLDNFKIFFCKLLKLSINRNYKFQTEPFDDPVAYKGEVIVGLKFVPPDPTQQERDREAGSERSTSKSKKNMSRGALHVLVKEARNLQTRAKNSGTCDPFCKRYHLLILALFPSYC